jgi:hypothetical protein
LDVESVGVESETLDEAVEEGSAVSAIIFENSRQSDLLCQSSVGREYQPGDPVVIGWSYPAPDEVDEEASPAGEAVEEVGLEPEGASLRD